MFLQPEIIDLIEEIINSPFMWLVFQLPAIRKLGRKTSIPNSYNLLARQEIRDLFKGYATSVLELFEQYNKRVPEEKRIKLSHELWADDIAPKIGSGRQ